MLKSFLTLALDVGEWSAERTLVANEQEVQQVQWVQPAWMFCRKIFSTAWN
jgi:hypothetical protein